MWTELYRARFNLLFVVGALLFFRDVLFLGRVIPWDLQGFHLAHAHLYADAIARGELPLWDPFTYCGRPFQANIQTQVFYPTVALAAWLGSIVGREHLFFLLELNVILHTVLAGVMAFRLGRVLNLRLPSALLLGIVYQMGAFFAIHAEHMGAVTVAAWIPLAWASVIELASTPGRRPALLLALALSLSILGGLTPLAAAVAASVMLLALLLVWIEKAPWRVLWLTAAAGAGSALLCLAQLGPTLQLTQHSIAQFRSDWLKSGGGVPLQALVTMLWPNYWGAFDLATYRLKTELTFSYLYCGLVTLGLAVAAVWAWRTRRHAVFVLMTVVTGFAMLGDSTVAGRAVYRVFPVGLRNGLHPEYTMPAFLLAVTVLAALGLERWVKRPRTEWAVLAVCAIDLLAVNSGRYWHASTRKSSPEVTRQSFEGYRESVDRLRALSSQEFPSSRFDTLHGAMPWAMYAPVFAIPTANGNDPLALARLIQVRLAFTPGERWGAYYEPSDLASPVLDMLNVRYLIGRERLSDAEIAGSAWTWKADVPGFSIYENARALPRFWLAGQVVWVKDAAEAARPVAAAGLGGKVRVLSYGLRELELAVDTAQPAYLATSEVHFPGWRAWINGAETPIYYTNVAFRGLWVPAGQHRVTMRFEPALLAWCCMISALAWAAWLYLWFRRPH